MTGDGPPDDANNVISLEDSRAKKQASDDPPIVAESHFKILGYDDDKFYFLPRASGQIVPLTAAQMGLAANLCRLAPMHEWEGDYPAKGGYDKNAAVNALIQACYERGIFDASRVRGRGAWIDDGKVVFHQGDALVVNRETVSVSAHQSKYIYPERAPFGVELKGALAIKEAARFLELCQMVRFERPWMATLLAGWIAVAPICGALAHRPHLWVIGESSSGKSYLEKQIIRPSLAGTYLNCQGGTTEAYLRQTLKSDARPILFDEAEGEGQANVMRMQRVLEFARASSSEDSSPVGKGAMDGTAVSFRPRSAICFFSIVPTLQAQADENRCTVLRLIGTDPLDHELKLVNAEHFEGLKHEVAELLTHDFSMRLLARSLGLLKIIRRNADTFARAAAEVLPSRRNGDQLGALLAGAYSLSTSKIISLDEARAYIADLGWIDETVAAQERDHYQLLDTICETQVTIRDDGGGTFDRSLGELMTCAAGFSGAAAKPDDEQCRRALHRYGIAVNPQKGTAFFASKHMGLGRVLRETNWSRNWAELLLRVKGATKPATSLRVGPVTKRGVLVPIEQILRRSD